jgi:hypothetical protein
MIAARRAFTFIVLIGAAVWGVPLGAQQPAAAPPALTPEQMEVFLLKARVVSLRDAGAGVTASRRATLTDGQLTHDAHVQMVDESKARFATPRGVELNFRDSYRYNIAGYRLAVLVGLDNVPMSVERTVAGRRAAVTWWIDDVTMDDAERIKRRLADPDPVRNSSQVHIQRVFDELIQNTDRNSGNLLWTSDWKMWLIDHTRAFRLGRALQSPALLARCERTLMERMRGLTAATVKDAVGDSLTLQEADAVAVRARLLVEFFDKRIVEVGEERVLYTKQ